MAAVLASCVLVARSPKRYTTKVGTLGFEGAAPGSGRVATSSRFHRVVWVLAGRTRL
jgi:hypothetical protein